MRNNEYIEGLMRSLTSDQKAQIREHYNAADAEYARFRVSVFNAGVAIYLTFGDEPMELDPETWNGYDCNMTVEGATELLDRYNL